MCMYFQEKTKVKIHWSYYELPGFKPAEDGDGYVPCKKCLSRKKIPETCIHAKREKW